MAAYVNGETINNALIFNILRGISSYPAELLGLRDLIILLISLLEVWCHLILGKGYSKLWSRYFKEFVLNTISFLSALIESIIVSATDKNNLLNRLDIDSELF